jgi:hypothetical protein
LVNSPSTENDRRPDGQAPIDRSGQLIGQLLMMVYSVGDLISFIPHHPLKSFGHRIKELIHQGHFNAFPCRDDHVDQLFLGKFVIGGREEVRKVRPILRTVVGEMLGSSGACLIP